MKKIALTLLCFFNLISFSSELEYVSEEILPDTVALSDQEISLNQSAIRSLASEEEVQKEGTVEFWILD